MNKKIILIFSLFCFSFLFSAHHEYKLYDTFYGNDGYSKFDVDVGMSFVNTEDNNLIVCQGTTTNLNNYIDKEVTYRNMNILSFCNSLIGVSSADGQYICGSGYSVTSSSTDLISGKVLPINPTERNTLFDTFPTKTFFFDTHSNFNKYLKNNGMALLSKFPRIGQTPQNVDKASGKVGVGCIGSYEYVLERGILGPGGMYYATIDSYNGHLDGTGENYSFDDVGFYRVRYTYSVTNCFTLFEEKYGTTNYTHLFKENIKSPTERSTARTLNLQVVKGDEPSYNVEGKGATCGISGTPVELVKGETVTVKGSMKIKNDYTVPIRITEINALYRRVGGIFATPDVEVGTITTNLNLPLTIQPGSEKTITVNVPSRLKDIDDAQDEYILVLTFNHEYDEHPQGCHLDGSGVGFCNTNLRISVDEEEPEPIRTLSATVNVEPNIIDVNFVMDGKDKVDIFGDVTLTINDGKTPPTITTEKIGGADVTLTELNLISGVLPFIKYTNCLVSPRNIETSNINPNKGNYRFDDVQLRSECLEYDLSGSLIAHITVNYDGIKHSTSGSTNVNTMLNPLSCDLTYKLISSDYRPGEGEEEYEISVDVFNDYELNDVIEYKCGNNEDEEWKTTSKDNPTFNCNYEFDLIKAEDIIYVVNVKVEDDIKEGREAYCSANIGMCLPYI